MNSYSARAKNNYSRKLFLMITSFVLFASLVCLITNFSVDRTISWSLYPIGALIVVWSTVSPLLLFNRYRFLGLFAGLTFSVILYLLLIQNLAGQKGWLLPLALPIVILSLAAFGISLAAFTAFKSNKLYAAAVTVFLFGVVVNLGVDVIVGRFINDGNLADTSKILTTIGSAITALILMIAGFIRSNRIRGNVVFTQHTNK